MVLNFEFPNHTLLELDRLVDHGVFLRVFQRDVRNYVLFLFRIDVHELRKHLAVRNLLTADGRLHTLETQEVP